MTKVFERKEFGDTFLFRSVSISEYSGQISRKTIDSTYPINSFKEQGFSRKTSASFRLPKIYKHVKPSERDMSTQNAAS